MLEQEDDAGDEVGEISAVEAEANAHRDEPLICPSAAKHFECRGEANGGDHVTRNARDRVARAAVDRRCCRMASSNSAATSRSETWW
jgi:hypothetical protein